MRATADRPIGREVGRLRVQLSEAKGPARDRPQRAHFLEALTGTVYLWRFKAAIDLDPEILGRTAERRRTA